MPWWVWAFVLWPPVAVVVGVGAGKWIKAGRDPDRGP